MISRRRLLVGAGVLGLTFRDRGLLAQQRTSKETTSFPPEPSPEDERVARIVESARTGGRRLPGMIGAVVRGGKLAAIGASGVRKVGSTEPIRVDDLVHLGSCTKALTASMIGTLVDDGKLGWDTTIGEVFPDRSGAIHPEFLRVTMSWLLSHRGGLPHDAAYWGVGRGKSPTDQRRALLSSVLRNPPRDRPGTKYEYSNVGYILAGLMAEEVGGASWEELMRRRLFGPLGMASAGFGPPGRPGQVDQPWGHRAIGDELRPVQEDNPPVMGPAGRVHCSVPDWAKFASMHLGASVGGTRLLKPETLEALHTPRPGEDYVGGWMVFDRSWGGGRVLNHSGSNTTWYVTIWVAPVRDFALLVATNAGGDQASAACEQAIGELLRSVEGDRPRRR